MRRRIAIFGAGGFGREVLQVIRDINADSRAGAAWEPVGFLVDSQYLDGRLVQGLPLLDSGTWLQDNPDVDVVIAVGASAARKRIAQTISDSCDNRFATLIHPRAWIGDGVEVGDGTVICAGSLITTDIRLGRHVHVNIGSTIGHDALLGDFVTLNPSVNVSGNVTIGTGTEVGTGSVLIPYAHIGNWTIIGAGSVITKPMPGNATVVGAPAKAIKSRPDGWHKARG